MNRHGFGCVNERQIRKRKQHKERMERFWKSNNKAVGVRRKSWQNGEEIDGFMV